MLGVATLRALELMTMSYSGPYRRRCGSVMFACGVAALGAACSDEGSVAPDSMTRDEVAEALYDGIDSARVSESIELLRTLVAEEVPDDRRSLADAVAEERARIALLQRHCSPAQLAAVEAIFPAVDQPAVDP